MKKIILLTVTAAAAVAAYFVWENCASASDNDNELHGAKRNRHMTDVFSKAKQQAMSEE